MKSETKLRDMMAQSPDILFSRARMKGLLNDIFLNDVSKVNLLMAAYDVGIIGEIRKSYPLDALNKGRYIKILFQQYSIIEDKAEWAVQTWNDCFSQYILKEIERLETEVRTKEAIIVAQDSTQDEENFVARSDEMCTRDDFDDYYINPTIEESRERIYIPCGVGNTDKGFFIHGITKTLLCTTKEANIFALVYNLLIRNSKITNEDIPHYFSNIDSLYDLDYRSIYRLSIVLLQMVKNNYMSDSALELCYLGDRNTLKYAVGMINHYTALFCRLIGTEPAKIQIRLGNRGHKVSLDGNDGIYVRNNVEVVSNAREIWYGQKINYRLTSDNQRDLEYLLSEISPYDSFKEGQLEVLSRMLGSKKHMVCIMPTGSGKSLIFYLASLLQPLPMFVVVPTEILIEDQVRNLKKIHHIDNVAHLRLTDDNSFSEYDIHNSINYITPMTLQNRNLLVKFRYINSGTKLIKMCEERIATGPLVSYIVLDEIHCLSNWGHDFRPEYLMLSKNLNKYLDEIRFLGFTATANFTVVEDVQQQLEIPQENFLSPVSFEKFNIAYDFRCAQTSDEMYVITGEITQHLIEINERTIIFTKSDEISRRVADVVGYEADIFSSDNPEAYHHFVDGKCKVLIASEELGIGISFPNINNIIHFGLPLSKNEYVQEIGRAGRANERVRSYLIYLENCPANVPQRLLMRNAAINSIPNLLAGVNNDYADIYRKLTNNCPTEDKLYNNLIALYNRLVADKQVIRRDSFGLDAIENVKKKLFMLYTVGYINDWYSCGMSKDGKCIDVTIDISSTDPRSYEIDPTKMLRRMKSRLRDYFDYLGNNRESIAKADRAKTPEEVIRVYVDWYYTKYLYHHSEQFLDLYEFIIGNAGNASEQITASIKDYFTLPFIKLKSEEALYTEMSLKEIINKVIPGVSRTALINIERVNSNRYSYKLDFMLFCGHLRMNGQFEASRLERLVHNIPTDDKNDFVRAFLKLYTVCEVSGKLAMLNYLEGDLNIVGISDSEFLSRVYSNGPKDFIYYGIMAQRANRHFEISRRSHHV